MQIVAIKRMLIRQQYQKSSVKNQRGTCIINEASIVNVGTIQG